MGMIRDGRHWGWLALAWGLAGVALAVVYRGDSLVPQCVILQYTGIYCPGCGMTRGLHQLFRGQIGPAIRYNPLVLLVAGLGVGLFLRQLGELLSGRQWHQPDWARWFWTLVAVFLLFGILRNLSGFPFEYLRPPD